MPSHSIEIPCRNPHTEDGKHDDDDIAVGNRKPAAKTQEEMLTTAVQEHMLTKTNLDSLAIGGQVVPWICEFCDSQWPPFAEEVWIL